jgi:hypothetical protein
MTGMSGWIRTATATAIVVLSATAASPQSNHEHATSLMTSPQKGSGQPFRRGHSMAAMHKDWMTRMAAEDALLEALVADMNMFTGDVKVEAMARLLARLVERQSIMREHMIDMHGQMVWNMMSPVADAPAERPPDANVNTDSEADIMCAPTTY